MLRGFYLLDRWFPERPAFFGGGKRQGVFLGTGSESEFENINEPEFHRASKQ